MFVVFDGLYPILDFGDYRISVFSDIRNLYEEMVNGEIRLTRGMEVY